MGDEMGNTRDPFLSLSESLSFLWPHLSFISRLCDAAPYFWADSAAPARRTQHTPKADSRGAAASTGQKQKYWVDAERFYSCLKQVPPLNLQPLCSSSSFPSYFCSISFSCPSCFCSISSFSFPSCFLQHLFFLPILLFGSSPLIPAHQFLGLLLFSLCGISPKPNEAKDSDLSISPTQNLIPVWKQSVLCKIWAFRLKT